jgi:hypothetical protein
MLEKPKGTIKNGPMKRQWKYWAHKTKCRQRTNKNTQHRKLKIWRDTDHTEKPGVNPCAREGSAVPASYKTPGNYNNVSISKLYEIHAHVSCSYTCISDMCRHA